MTGFSFVVLATVFGAAWRRWLGEAETGMRTVKVATAGVVFGMLFFAAAPAFAAWWAAPALTALVTTGCILPHVSGFGPDDGWRDLRNIALRWMPVSVPGAVALTIAGPWWAFVAFPAACALAALAWPALERIAGRTHRLGPLGYTEIAEGISGALVFGSAALLWRPGP